MPEGAPDRRPGPPLRIFGDRRAHPVDPTLVWWWPETMIDPVERKLLEALLRSMTLFDRSEGWVRAELLDDAGVRPVGGEGWELRLAGRDPVRVIAPARQRDPLAIGDAGWTVARSGPEALSPEPGARPRVTVVRFGLEADDAPPLGAALPFGERARRALIFHRCRDRHSAVITGKRPDGTRLSGHGHAHYLSTDEDGDGRIDHLTVYAPYGFDAEDLEALLRLETLVGGRAMREVGLRLEALGDPASLIDLPLFRPSRRWRSVTPFSLPWFASRGAGRPPRPRDRPEAQLRRELELRGLPAPRSIRVLEERSVAGGGVAGGPSWWQAFEGRRLNGTAGHGLIGFELELDAPLAGPLALGFGCHFGLGLFLPEEGAGGA
jgi:CRISPR-associated protein Csb2